MNELYISLLAPHISRFINLKKNLGFKYESNKRILKDFDSMVAVQFSDSVTITKEIINAWIELKSANPKSLEHNVSAVRQFAKYLNGIDSISYIPPTNIVDNREHYLPHIYTKDETIAFFKAIDNCPCRKVSPTRHLVIPMIFRLLYCCGLRASEALNLYRSEIDLSTGKITIHASKGWTGRLVYVSDDLLENLQEYDALIEAMIPGRLPFFPNKNGDFYTDGTLDRWFHEFWDNLPEASLVSGNKPRVHDWRHTMLTERLNRWVKENEDINALYVYLSEYAGHSTYASTDYYLHLVSSFYPEMEKKLSSLNIDILPEVCKHEYYE